MNRFDIAFGQELCDLLADELGLVCSFMAEEGRIVASSQRERIGDIHEVAARIMLGEMDEYLVGAAEAAGSKGMREGYNRAIDLAGKRLIVFAIAGPLATVRPVVRVVSFCVSSLLRVRLADKNVQAGCLTDMLGQAGMRFEHNLTRLQDAVDNIEQGIVMFDPAMRLVVWNARFLELTGIPPEIVSVGVSMPELFRFNAERGEYGPGDVDNLVEERMALASQRVAHRFEQVRPNGTILEIAGRPLPNGGFVSTYTDITLRHQAETALRASEQRFLSLSKMSADWFWEQDEHFRFTEISGWERYHRTFPNASSLGKTRWEIDYLDADEAFWDRHRELLARHEPYYDLELRRLDEDGMIRIVHVSGEPVFDEKGRFTGYRGVGRDVTENKRALEALHIASTVYQASAEAMTVTDANDLIISVNPAFEQTTGYRAEEVIGKNPRVLSSGRQDKAFYQAMWRSLQASGHWSGEIWNRRKNGEVYLEQLTINTTFNQNGTVNRRVALFSDITERKKAEELIWRQANFDSLTELPNRRMFYERLAQEIKKAHRAKNQLAVLFIDLDNFKEVNDTLGHNVGDRLLIEAAQRITDCIRETDCVARLGGDEFTVLLTDIGDAGSVKRVTLSILNKLAEPFRLGDEVTIISASIGITLYPRDSSDLGELLKNADQAMYIAKKQGRNRYSYFTPSLQLAAQSRLRLINDLRGAVAGDELRVHFQPIVELASGRIHKAEALVRWQHPQRDLVNPAEFITVAEETGLIIEIGDWVFKESARWAKRWRLENDDDFQVSVNKSPVQFQKNNPYDGWLAHMLGIGLPGQAIVVEITESLLLGSDSPIIDSLLAYRDSGVQVAIDDFGTGYSSLAYLKRFDIDYLKIDQSFTRNLAPGSSDMALSEAIIVMAHKLGLKVIAEGVETAEQRDLLTAAGCDYAQGYLFAQPLPPEEFEKLLLPRQRTASLSVLSLAPAQNYD
jgi:diguanylate cyclase (GGDEF)-like protein/PAS domain S-box-containing protein